jgi:hypothetical protein
MKRRCGHLVHVALPLGLAFGLNVTPAAAQSEATNSTAECLLAGCQRSPTSGGTLFNCHGLVAGVTEQQGVPPSQVLEIMVATFRSLAGAGGEVSTAETTFAAEGKEWPGVLLSLRRAGETTRFSEGHLLIFESGQETTRAAFCLISPAQPVLIEVCQKVLPFLAEKGPAPFRIPSSEPTFLGKPLAIPAGCETVDASDKGFKVQCGETAVLVSMKVRKLEDLPSAVGAVSAALLSMAGATTGQNRDCRIGGVTVQCRTIHSGEGPNRVVAYIGGAEVENVPVVVACAQPADQTGVHPLCANVMTFSAGAAADSQPPRPH